GNRARLGVPPPTQDQDVIVDFHSHFFSRTFFDTLAAASPLPGTPDERTAHVLEATGLRLPDADPVEHWATWQAELDRYGVEHLVTFASVPEEADDVARAVAASGGRASALCVVDPTKDGAAARVDRLLGELGFRGVLLFPALHHFDPSGTAADEVFRVVAAHHALATVHTGLLAIALRDRFGLPRGYDLAHADPLRLIPAADRHPDAHFVLPHFGGGFLREALMAGAQCQNVCVDTSSSNSWMRTNPGRITLVEVFERCLEVFGGERILFGTDSSVFPRGWRHDLLTQQREALGATGADGATLRAVFGGNAARLLGLGAADAAPTSSRDQLGTASSTRGS
ncbi:MAG: amidohydrolase family protein, partial [Planctomycetota bacterium]